MEICKGFKKLQWKMIGHSMLIMLMTLIVGLGLWIFLLGGFEVWPGHIISFLLPETIVDPVLRTIV